MEHDVQSYGLWGLVIINSAVFIIFAFSFFKPRTARDWRTFGTFSAFIVALFVEMYGFPLTIFLLSGWLQTRFPDTDLFAHDAGHLLTTLIGYEGNPHFSPFHIASNVLILAGFILLARAWKVLYAAQGAGRLATAGPYAHVRHPQYAGFVIIMFGFLLQWPTLLTLAMFPVLVTLYSRLAVREEEEMERIFGGEWLEYSARTPRFVPGWKSPHPARHGGHS